jgi:hypothetical protein
MISLEGQNRSEQECRDDTGLSHSRLNYQVVHCQDNPMDSLILQQSNNHHRIPEEVDSKLIRFHVKMILPQILKHRTDNPSDEENLKRTSKSVENRSRWSTYSMSAIDQTHDRNRNQQARLVNNYEMHRMQQNELLKEFESQLEYL